MTPTRCILLLTLLPTLAHADPVARWTFGQEETTPLIAHGGVHRDQPGPRPPTFPDFDPSNLAVKFDGSGAHFAFADPGPLSPFDFTNGDAITLEAFVNVEDLRKGENVYLIGKGRTHAPGYPKDNQNWALRLREAAGEARISFLFATPPQTGEAKDAHWHRWTTSAGFAPSTGWHHVAVAYKFGSPDSVRGWIDGKPVPGTWDMGGPTKEAPVVDDDAIWIGSSMGGSPANSFRGLLDEIAIHRELLSDDTVKSRYRREGPPVVATAAGATTKPATAPAAPEVMPVIANVPAGQVLVTLAEGLAAHDRWFLQGEAEPAETVRYTTTDLLLPRLPLRYDPWGIRDGWKGPVLLRAAADVTLPAGPTRVLLRARGLSRLWINGQLVARLKQPTGGSDGHHPVIPIPAPPLPLLHPLAYGDQEIAATFDVPADGRCRVVLESAVGTKKARAEPGETFVAVQPQGAPTFTLLTPSITDAPTPIEEKAWPTILAKTEQSLAALDDATRRRLAASQDDFWRRRHEAAAQWAAAHPASAIPAVHDATATHPIDAFLAAKAERALAASTGAGGEQAKRFHADVLPLLADNCFRCHGEKEKGGLRLNSREAALKSGKSGDPAITPGDPANSELLRRIKSTDEDERMPPKGDALKPNQIAALEAWIKSGAPWPAAPVAEADVKPAPLVTDPAFLRRAYLDAVGVPPSEAEARAFLADTSPDKRDKLVDRLLSDPRFADAQMGYWQDVLAENPNILKPSLNNSGPFRWFLYDAFRDGKPFDRLVTELILLRGSKYEGGSAGFGMAADNDAPLAARGQVVASAFLGAELQCARCHDAPFHSFKQKDLYSIAAMLERKTVTVPKTSTVPAAFFEKKARESQIKVTLKPGEPITPTWPFAATCADTADLDPLMLDPADTRERLAALITAPQDERFAQVIVNRVWKRLIGVGFVEPAGDWEGHAPSHPDLLTYLARDFVAHGYDLRHLTRTIMTSRAYQREATGRNLKPNPDARFFTAAERRRLTAEQVVDALYFAGGKSVDVEELTFDPEGRQAASTMISLGKPCRAWQFASLSNERDRPSLALPRAQAVTDVLEAFGWSGSRQNPRTDRETDPNVLQPGALANSVLSTWVTRASANSALADLAVGAQSPESLTDSLFLRYLSRYPTPQERAAATAQLAPGFADRLTPSTSLESLSPPPKLPRVSWGNHLSSEANIIKLEMEKRARAGEPPDPRLAPAWREAYEDVIWSLINTPEFAWMP